MTPAGYRIRDRFTGYLRPGVWATQRTIERVAARDNADYGPLCRTGHCGSWLNQYVTDWACNARSISNERQTA